MEPLSNYSMPAYNFTIWFFRLVLLMILVVTVIVFTFNINETVSIKEGEIVAANPQSDYKAPFEAQVTKIYVQIGSVVKAGDTLIVMKNADYPEQQATTKATIMYLEKKIQSFDILQNVLQRKKLAIEQEGELTAKKYQIDINQLVSDTKALDQQYNYHKQRLLSADEKYTGDSVLYKKDMLSRYEFNNTRDATLALKESLNTVEGERNRQQSQKNIAYNNFTKEQNTLMLGKTQLYENEQSIIQAKNDYESQLIQAKEALKKIKSNLNQQNVIATGAGVINYLFNTRESSNFISKGELLVVIVPKSISYYAKLIIPEKDMPYVKTGLAARLNFDAYNESGNEPINGSVFYIAESKEKEKFYALIHLEQENDLKLKPGYTVYGQIIVGQLPLYKYFIKKIFRQYNRT